MQNKIEHVIVLMLENRSFDHMLGYLDHPDPTYPKLDGSETNPYSGNPHVPVNYNAGKIIFKGPSHSHNGVMRQIFNTAPSGNWYKYITPNNQGFVNEHENYVREEENESGYGPDVMKCFKPSEIPVLSLLAKEFAVCTNWHCSVPGMTWPNRCYLHAGTSEGEVNISLRRLFSAETIFERLIENRIKYRVYTDGPSHLGTYKRLWFNRKHRSQMHNIDKFCDHVINGRLGAYNFIEPRHFSLGGMTPTSQHPENSETKDGNHNSMSAFDAAEQLVARVYKSLRSNLEVFNKTLLVITYDEHGGFFDRIPPPGAIPPDHDFFKDQQNKFYFDLLGVRVPAVLVSPHIKKGTINNTLYDHTSVIRSLCKRFLKDGDHLKKRDFYANDFWSVINVSEPRTEENLPYIDANQKDDVSNKEYTGAKIPSLDIMQEALIELSFVMYETIPHDTKTLDVVKDDFLGLKKQWQERRQKGFAGIDLEKIIKFAFMVSDGFQKNEEVDPDKA